MKKLLTLKKDYSIKLKSQITKHTEPKYVYLPISEKTIITKKEVKKEEKITEDLISPVSGQIIGSKYCMNETGTLVKCLAVLNDYKENLKKRNASVKNLDKISWEKILIDLNNHGAGNLAKMLTETQKQNCILLNGIEDEPYVANEIFINKEYTSEILETLDILKDKIPEKSVKIAVKTSDRENIEKYESLLGTYSQIELVFVPDEYLIGHPYFLKKYLNINDCCILKPSEVKTIYDIIKHHRFITTHLFTISGNAVENPQVVEAKMGSSVCEIIKEHIKIKKNCHPKFYINGLMKGKMLEIENLIVTPNVQSILIMEEETQVEQECINCGKCVSVCVANCNPKMAYEGKKNGNLKNCIDCGLCSYICPANINLRQFVFQKKDHPALHFESENNYLYHFVIALLPLIIYGIYKNGILPYLNQDISLISLFKPLLFPFIGFLIGCVVDYVIWWKNGKDKIWTNTPLYGLLITMTLSIQTNLFIVSPLLFLIYLGIRSLEKKKISLSPLFIGKGIMVIILTLFASVSFANPSEASHIYAYSIIDILFGRSIGGICTTSIFWMLIGYFYLCFDPFYKKEIPIYSIGSFFILTFIFELILPTGDLLRSLLNSSFFFGCIFIASEMKYSPFMEQGRKIYGILIGVIGFFFTRFLSNTEGIYLSIFLVSFFVSKIDHFFASRKAKHFDNFCRLTPNQK